MLIISITIAFVLGYAVATKKAQIKFDSILLKRKILVRGKRNEK